MADLDAERWILQPSSNHLTNAPQLTCRNYNWHCSTLFFSSLLFCFAASCYLRVTAHSSCLRVAWKSIECLFPPHDFDRFGNLNFCILVFSIHLDSLPRSCWCYLYYIFLIPINAYGTSKINILIKKKYISYSVSEFRWNIIYYRYRRIPICPRRRVYSRMNGVDRKRVKVSVPFACFRPRRTFHKEYCNILGISSSQNVAACYAIAPWHGVDTLLFPAAKGSWRRPARQPCQALQIYIFLRYLIINNNKRGKQSLKYEIWIRERQTAS